MRTRILAVTIAVAAGAVLAQEASPAFEVISVKPSAMEGGAYGIGIATFPGGRIRANMCPLAYIISQAFDLEMNQISGGPRWVREDRWDIEAKPPEGSKASKANPKLWKLPPNEDQRLMMETLLADRFHFKYHLETKEGPVFFLVKTKKELKLTPTADADEFPWVGSVAGGGIGNDGLRATNVTIALVCKRLTARLGRTVIDQTGLDGVYDFKFALDKDASGTEMDVPSAIMASVEGLGLKLESGKGPTVTLVIDSVEKPAGN
jgi:uncharacterized protein (TIGR03435 family)